MLPLLSSIVLCVLALWLLFGALDGARLSPVATDHCWPLTLPSASNFTLAWLALPPFRGCAWPAMYCIRLTLPNGSSRGTATSTIVGSMGHSPPWLSFRPGCY